MDRPARLARGFAPYVEATSVAGPAGPAAPGPARPSPAAGRGCPARVASRRSAYASASARSCRARSSAACRIAAGLGLGRPAHAVRGDHRLGPGPGLGQHPVGRVPGAGEHPLGLGPGVVGDPVPAVPGLPEQLLAGDHDARARPPAPRAAAARSSSSRSRASSRGITQDEDSGIARADSTSATSSSSASGTRRSASPTVTVPMRSPPGSLRSSGGSGDHRRGRPCDAHSPVGSRCRQRRSSNRAASRSRTSGGTRWPTSPPHVATSFTRLEDRKLYSGLVGMKRVSTPVRPWFICAIFSS